MKIPETWTSYNLFENSSDESTIQMPARLVVRYIGDGSLTDSQANESAPTINIRTMIPCMVWIGTERVRT